MIRLGHLLENLSWPEAKEVFEEVRVAVIPTGSCEQHGPHLPIGTDYLVAQELSSRVCDMSSVVVTPTIPIGYADYHSDFPGTLSLSEETLTKVYQEVCSYLIRYGITHIVFINGHGGNIGSINSTMSFLRAQEILAATIMWYEVSGELNEDWRQIGHGDFIETSLLLAINEENVNLDVAEVPERKNLSKELVLDDIHNCKFKGAPVHVGLRTRDYTDTGDMIEYGQSPGADHSVPPTEASKEKGEAIIQGVSEYISDFIEEFKDTSLPL